MRVITLTCHVGTGSLRKAATAAWHKGAFLMASCHAGRSKGCSEQRQQTSVAAGVLFSRLSIGCSCNGIIVRLSCPLSWEREKKGRDGKGWMQGDMLVGRARNPTTYSTSLPTHTLFPPAARAHPPPVIAAAVHMEMAVAPGRREALGSCHGISCVAESLVRCRTTTRPGRARDRRCSVGARWTSVWTTANMCVCCMCVHVCAA